MMKMNAMISGLVLAITMSAASAQAQVASSIEKLTENRKILVTRYNAVNERAEIAVRANESTFYAQDQAIAAPILEKIICLNQEIVELGGKEEILKDFPIYSGGATAVPAKMEELQKRWTALSARAATATQYGQLSMYSLDQSQASWVYERVSALNVQIVAAGGKAVELTRFPAFYSQKN